jgi:hypothetical protein
MTEDAASADIVAAGEFPLLLKSPIDEGDFSLKQVFNIDETSLLQKRMPNQTSPGIGNQHLVSKEQRIIVQFFCMEMHQGITTSSPLMVYYLKNSRALNGC